MPSYTTISNALVAVGAKPFATTVQALRDNTVAIAEADATVPLGLLPTVLLSSLSPSGVSSSTASGLNLQPYKLLLISYSFTTNVSSGTGTLSLGSATLATGIPSVANTAAGIAIVDLASTRAGNMYGGGGTNAGSNTTGYGTGSTSVAMSISGTGATFTGTWRLFGLK